MRDATTIATVKTARYDAIIASNLGWDRSSKNR
jgi:hypothetical protein